MSKNLNVEAFIQKAVMRKEQMLTNFDIETKNYGKVNFTRPKNAAILKYMDMMASAVVTEGEGENTKIVEQDFNMMLEASKELVYNSCAILQNKELHEKLEIQDPLETAVEVFGINETIELAGKIIEMVEGGKTQKDAAEKLKN